MVINIENNVKSNEKKIRRKIFEFPLPIKM